jgi:2,3-bisphosphoglycerate-independent phosphoglycerate mutase
MEVSMKVKNMVSLIILDGYGLTDKNKGNAIELANKPFIDSLFKKYPHNTLSASGLPVGLPDGVMGNSEVGHQTIGSGRITYQSLTRIDVAIKDKSFFENEEFLKAIENVKKNNSKLHILGLCSDGGVHAMTTHIIALNQLASIHGIGDKTYFHAFMDGRDTPPTSGKGYLEKVINEGLNVASVHGRYYGMDRDNNWDRIQVSIDTMTKGSGDYYPDPLLGIQASYDEGKTDEFIYPFISDKNGLISDNDSIIFANFRPDRAIRMATVFTKGPLEKYYLPGKPKFDSSSVPNNIYFVGMMYYADTVLGHTAFHHTNLDNIYGQIISEKGYKQLRIAETEKYAHVTFFFDGGQDIEYPGEKRVLVASPKVATYDLQPEMSAYEVARLAVQEILTKEYDTMILNFANPDMVGHTGVIPAVIKAIETVDECLNQVVSAILSIGGIAIIIADHGNAEVMISDTGEAMTAHTTNLVPIIITKENVEIRDNGGLSDIAPTLLTLLGIDIPKEMTGKSLIKK